jgi:hypothetical protein
LSEFNFHGLGGRRAESDLLSIINDIQCDFIEDEDVGDDHDAILALLTATPEASKDYLIGEYQKFERTTVSLIYDNGIQFKFWQGPT